MPLCPTPVSRGDDNLMNILIIGLNYAPEPVGIGPFTTGLAEYLVEQGHRVTVHTAPPYYPEWRVLQGYANRWSDRTLNGVHILRAPLFVPATPSGRNRLLHLVSFTLSSFLPVLERIFTTRPDVVLCVAPSLVTVPLGWLAAKLARAKLWVHVQDFEVEAAFASDLLKKGTVFAKAASAVEKLCLSLADMITTISPAMCRKLISKRVAPERIFEFRNWAEIDAIVPLTKPSQFRERWKITAPHVALYSGNIANKQGLEIIVEAARLSARRTDLMFVICGNGSNRADLERLAIGCDNIIFHDLQPRELLGELLGLATVHLLPQIAWAADLVLPSKLANMLASGRPVVATAEAGTGLANEVEGCGLVVPPGDAAAFSSAILALIDDEPNWQELCENARQRAVGSWSKARILQRLNEQLIDRLTVAGDRTPVSEIRQGA